MKGLGIKNTSPKEYNLGSKVIADRHCEQEVNTRISKANQAFAMLSLWRSIGLTIHIKSWSWKATP